MIIPEDDPCVINVQASFPVNTEGDQFAMNVNFSTLQPTDDYDDRMCTLAVALHEIASEIEKKHAPGGDWVGLPVAERV